MNTHTHVHIHVHILAQKSLKIEFSEGFEDSESEERSVSSQLSGKDSQKEK